MTYYLPGLYTLVILAIATATVSMTVTMASIFRFLREWFEDEEGFRGWLGELLTCPYCLSHWTAALFTFLYKPQIITYPPSLSRLAAGAILNGIVSWLVMVALSAGFCGLIFKFIAVIKNYLPADQVHDQLKQILKRTQK
jgi:hypothetical protein